jgi:hypothetical protein
MCCCFGNNISKTSIIIETVRWGKKKTTYDWQQQGLLLHGTQQLPETEGRQQRTLTSSITFHMSNVLPTQKQLREYNNRFNVLKFLMFRIILLVVVLFDAMFVSLLINWHHHRNPWRRLELYTPRSIIVARCYELWWAYRMPEFLYYWLRSLAACSMIQWIFFQLAK